MICMNSSLNDLSCCTLTVKYASTNYMRMETLILLVDTLNVSTHPFVSFNSTSKLNDVLLPLQFI